MKSGEVRAHSFDWQQSEKKNTYPVQGIMIRLNHEYRLSRASNPRPRQMITAPI